MYTNLILSIILGVASAQLAVPGVTQKPWQGPFSDHVLGVPPKDTPEVTAAKLALNQAYSQVLAVLPQLPPEETVHQIQPQPQFFQPQNPILPQLPAVPPTIKTFSEEIPRSPIGEVPEVHAARQAHLKAYQEVAANLPPLVDDTVHHYQVQKPTTQTPNWVYQQHQTVPTTVQHPGLVYQQYLVHQQQAVGHLVQDTPEVARAKAEHAAAVAAALG